MTDIEIFRQMIEDSNRIVFFGGAGVSTDSGIPDFRSQDGLYKQKYPYPPEEILSRRFFFNKPDEFYKFYKDKMNCLGYEPNIAHIKLAELEKRGKLKAIITQNIDGLHQKAGSKNVYELHGTVHSNQCLNCRHKFPAEYIFNSEGTPKCDRCGGLIKPNVVLYEEPLSEYMMTDAWIEVSEADMLIVAGTSLAVRPACNLVDDYKGDRLVLINKGDVEKDIRPNLRFDCSISEVFSQI